MKILQKIHCAAAVVRINSSFHLSQWNTIIFSLEHEGINTRRKVFIYL